MTHVHCGEARCVANALPFRAGMPVEDGGELEDLRHASAAYLGQQRAWSVCF